MHRPFLKNQLTYLKRSIAPCGPRKPFPGRRSCKTTNPGFSFMCILSAVEFLCSEVCCVRFNSFSIGQEVGWEEGPQNDLFCVEWGVKL